MEMIRDNLAKQRTKLANRRTLLAYMRTALMLFATAITLIKIFSQDEFLLWAGYILIPVSLLVMVYGIYSFIKFQKEINK